MWLFTRYGFFSAVCAREEQAGAVSAKVDYERIMVRARVRAHLERLMAAFPELFKEATIHESAMNDYRWRLFLPIDTWAAVTAALALDTDYDNFKSAAHREWPADAHGYCNMLHRVWSSHAQIQTNGNGKRVGAYSTGENATVKGNGNGNGNGKVKRKAGSRTLPKADPLEILARESLEEEPLLSDADLAALREYPADIDGAPIVPIEGEDRNAGAFAYPAGYTPGASPKGRPRSLDAVLVVRSRRGAAIGVVWWLDEFSDSREAYKEAIARKIIPEGGGLNVCYYQDTENVNVPIYDWRSF